MRYRRSCTTCPHAAEAIPIAHTGRRAKTHVGLGTAVVRLASETDEINQERAKLLARPYGLKSIADYGTRADAISAEDTRFAIHGAARSLNKVTRLPE